MANNELSGPIVSMGLINNFKNKKLNKTQDLSLFQKQLVQYLNWVKILDI